MIQLKPHIKLAIDQMSNERIIGKFICLILFYLIIFLLSHNGPHRFQIRSIDGYNCNVYGNNTQKNESEINCQFVYLVSKGTLSRFYTQISFQVKKEGLYNQQIVFQPPTLNQTSKGIFPKIDYLLTVIGQEEIMQSNYTNYTDYIKAFPVIDSKKIEIEKQLELIQNGVVDQMEIECSLNKFKEIDCLSGTLEEFEVNQYQKFVFLIQLRSGKYSHGFDKVKLNIINEDERYFLFNLFFQILFIFQNIYSLCILCSRLRKVPYVHWFQIHKWLLYLLGCLLVYNFPFQVLRYFRLSLIQEVCNKCGLLLLMSSLYYFWLSMFEILHKNTNSEQQQREQKYITRWNMFKLFVIFVYTLPQAVMNIFIFIEKEENSQFDPHLEIKFYSQYIKFQLACLFVYSLIYLPLSLKFIRNQNNPKPVIEEEVSKQHRKHDPFFQELQGTEIDQTQPHNEGSNFNLLQILSMTMFIAESIIRITNFLSPLAITSFTRINETTLFNFYLYLVNSLYLPYAIIEIPDNELQTKEKETEQIMNTVYADIELEDQTPEISLDKNQKLEREKLWKNIQKQMEEENKHQNFSDDDQEY